MDERSIKLSTNVFCHRVCWACSFRRFISRHCKLNHFKSDPWVDCCNGTHNQRGLLHQFTGSLRKEDGSIRWPVAFWMAPWLLFVRMVWHLHNIVSRTPLYSEIVPDLFVGRLCEYQSLPGDVSVVVDLTAEFPTPRSLRSKVLTICLPTLDGCPPDSKKCQQAFELIDNQSGRIYVCCANGHGRSVTFAAAWLGLQGKCLSAADSVKLIQAARPSAAPNRDQLSFLNNVFQIRKSAGPSTFD